MGRWDLSDAVLELIGPLLLSERGHLARLSGDNRLFLNGMLHVLRIGCALRDMHERYGKWNLVYVRIRRWAEQGVWHALLQTLVDLGLTGDWQHMIDSTTVRGHVSAVGEEKGELVRRLLVDLAAALRARSAPDVTIRASYWLHADGCEPSDYTAADALMNLPLPPPKGLLAD